MEVVDFVSAHLPASAVRLLEVGCGDGDLTRALRERGHEVVGIDPQAPSGPMLERVTLEEYEGATPFDAVVANRSLHHIHPLDRALDKIHSLLRADAVLIVNEFAWDQMDEATANWYLSHVDEPRPEDEPLLPGNFPAMWVEKYADLHTSSTIRTSLDGRFTPKLFEWVPYVARHYLDRPDLERDEARLMRSGRIRGIGFRWVGGKSDQMRPSPRG